MLKFTGTLGDKHYNNEPIPVELLFTIFGIPKTIDPEFRVTTERVKVDQFRQRQFPQSTSLPASCNLFVPGKASGTLRYTTGETFMPNGQGVTYTTKRVSAVTKESSVVSDQEMYAYIYLHPACETSPAHNVGSALYYFYDRDKVANEQLALMQAAAEIGHEIFTLDPDRLRVKAVGIRYKKHRQEIMLADAGSLGVAELRVSLSGMLKEHGADFIRAWKDTGTSLRGMVQLGIDKGIIVANTNGNGGNGHYWSEPNGGELITNIMHGVDSTVALLDAFNNNYVSLMPKLQKGLAMTTEVVVPESLTRVEMLSPEELTYNFVRDLAKDKLVAIALSKDYVSFNRTTGEVFFITPEGELEERPFFTADPKAENSIPKQLEEYLEEGKGHGQWQKLCKKIYTQNQPDKK